MAKFLIACYPIAGHLHPHMAVAIALRERGHEVAFYSSEIARPRIEGEGFEFFPFGAQLEEILGHVLRPGAMPFAEEIPTTSFPLLKVGKIREELSRWLLETMPLQIEDIQGLLDTWHPDVLLSDTTLLGSTLVLNETAPVPVALMSVLFACSIPGPDAPTWGRGLPPPRNWHSRLRSEIERIGKDWMVRGLRRQADEIRRRHGLPPMPERTITAMSGKAPLLLMVGVPELDYQRRDLPACVHYVGACLWDRLGEQSTPEWIAQLDGQDRPVVYVTEGTVHYRQPVVLREAVEALRDEDVILIMTTGAERDAESLNLGPLGPHMRVEPYVSHRELFPHTDVVVTTGGPGTIITALDAGTPVVVVPTGWDHTENAQRVVDAGVGVRLDPRRCTPRRLRTAIRRVLDDPSFKQNVGKVRRALRSAGGAPKAADLLEELLTKPT